MNSFYWRSVRLFIGPDLGLLLIEPSATPMPWVQHDGFALFSNWFAMGIQEKPLGRLSVGACQFVKKIDICTDPPIDFLRSIPFVERAIEFLGLDMKFAYRKRWTWNSESRTVMANIWAKLKQASKRRKRSSQNGSPHTFEARYISFKELLAANTQLLKIIADIEEKLLGQRLFGMAYVRSQASQSLR